MWALCLGILLLGGGSGSGFWGCWKMTIGGNLCRIRLERTLRLLALWSGLCWCQRRSKWRSLAWRDLICMSTSCLQFQCNFFARNKIGLCCRARCILWLALHCTVWTKSWAIKAGKIRAGSKNSIWQSAQCSLLSLLRLSRYLAVSSRGNLTSIDRSMTLWSLILKCHRWGMAVRVLGDWEGKRRYTPLEGRSRKSLKINRRISLSAI